MLPAVAAPAHQHFFNFRIDFDVDGTADRLVEQNVVSPPEREGTDSPSGRRRS